MAACTWATAGTGLASHPSGGGAGGGRPPDVEGGPAELDTLLRPDRVRCRLRPAWPRRRAAAAAPELPVPGKPARPTGDSAGAPAPPPIARERTAALQAGACGVPRRADRRQAGQPSARPTRLEGVRALMAPSAPPVSVAIVSRDDGDMLSTTVGGDRRHGSWSNPPTGSVN